MNKIMRAMIVIAAIQIIILICIACYYLGLRLLATIIEYALSSAVKAV